MHGDVQRMGILGTEGRHNKAMRWKEAEEPAGHLNAGF